MPNDRSKDVTYDRICCNYREQKEEKNHTKLMVGGDQINYSGNCGTPTSDLLMVKLLLNSVVSTSGANCMTLGILPVYSIKEIGIPTAEIGQLPRGYQ